MHVFPNFTRLYNPGPQTRDRSRAHLFAPNSQLQQCSPLTFALFSRLHCPHPLYRLHSAIQIHRAISDTSAPGSEPRIRSGPWAAERRGLGGWMLGWMLGWMVIWPRRGEEMLIVDQCGAVLSECLSSGPEAPCAPCPAAAHLSTRRRL
uniref:Uncharacterized protein n=1 Tax=Knipowitschia caucasica TaxID=637954 RepID=A0AAV2LA93_KNICA